MVSLHCYVVIKIDNNILSLLQFHLLLKNNDINVNSNRNNKYLARDFSTN